MTFLTKEDLDQLEVSPAVQAMLLLMKEFPSRFNCNFDMTIGAKNLWWIEDTVTRIQGGVYLNKDYFMGSIDFSGYTGLSFINGKEALEIYEAIQVLLKEKQRIEDQEAKKQFERAYQRP